jgi:hypothetical protein
MDDQVISRVHYFERQFLRRQDFADEQAYHLLKQRLHQLGQHRPWGIVRGLELTLDADCNPVLQPGVAVDGYGRDLVWAFQQALPVQEFDAKASDILDVWLDYNLVPGETAPPGYANCGDTSPGGAFYRIEELPILRLTVPNPAYPNARVPEGVLDDDLGFDATRIPPDEPTAFWPIFMGQVLRVRGKTGQPDQYSINPAGRPYAGLVGESVYHPTGNAWIEIGSSPANHDIGTKLSGPANRFAVFLQDPSQSADDSAASNPEPRLEITSDGQMTVCADTTLYGDLSVAGALMFEAAQSNLVPDKSRPWTFYRAIGQAAMAPAARGATPSQAPHTQELRIEIADNDAVPSQVVIGAWRKGPDGKEGFQPCLTVDDDCNIRVSGNLIVEGSIDKPSISAGATSTAEAMEAALRINRTTESFKAAVDSIDVRNAAVPQGQQSPVMVSSLLASLSLDELRAVVTHLKTETIEALKKVL